MIIKSLSIKQFRNLKDVSILPGPNLNVICGENGQGKTNLLEAIWLFCASRSFTGAADNEMVPFDSDFLRVEMCFDDIERENSACYVITSDRKKEAVLNKVPKKSLSHFVNRFYCVVFSPDDLLLIKGGPAERRRELDMVICQLKPQYSKLLAKYNKIITQRNSLLKKIKQESFPKELLLEYDEALAKAGTLISITRKSYCDRLCEIASGYYEKISSGREQLTFEYKSWSDDLTPQNLKAALQETQSRDLATGTTTSGPHRDDLLFMLEGRPAREFGSQGQQRSAVLSVKLAESVLVEQTTGEAPVILLDDVLSELDQSRRDYLLRNLKERQIFLTCCDEHQVAAAEHLFFIKQGRLIEQKG